MPITQMLLFYIPTPLLGLLIVGICVAFALGGLAIVRRFVPHHKLKLHNDVAGAIFNTLGVAYTVLLAFVVVMAWQNFDRSSLNVEKEANCIVDLYRSSDAFQKPFSDDTRALIVEYGKSIVTKEWKLLAQGASSADTEAALVKLWKHYISYEPRTENEKIFFAESVRKLVEAGELRRLRLLDSSTGIDPVIWFVLILGGLATIIFTLFFGTENYRAQMIMSAILAILIGMILLTVLLLDYPFTGGIQIRSGAFRPIMHI